jgi:hypothetical protein
VLATRRPAPLFATLKRNLPFAAALLPGLLPGPSSRFVALAALAAALGVEALVALRPLARELGQRRLGDLWAGTQVIDASIALQLPVSSPALRPAQRALAAPPARRQRAASIKTKPEEAACAWR